MDSATTIIEAGAPSEISWSAIFAGALVAVATSLGLLVLASGLGLATAPWFTAPSVFKITALASVWLVIMQWAAGAFGGYIAGRLRLRWAELHPREVFFRDTAHGFLSWIVSTLIVTAFIALAVPVVAHEGMRGAALSSHMAHERQNGPEAEGVRPASGENPYAYYIDALYRGSKTANAEVKAETGRILLKNTKEESFSTADKSYLAQLVAGQTGISGAEAASRVNGVLGQIEADKSQMKNDANKARKAASSFAFITFLSMLVGAFIASVSGVLGGRQRDRHN